MFHATTRHLLAGTSALLLIAVPSHAQPAATATVAGQAVTFVAPVGMYDPDQNTASMLFVTTPLTAAQESGGRRDGSWPVDGVGPSVKVALSFGAGKYSAAMGELDRCWIGINGFKADSIEISGNAVDCHLISTGGRLQPGGMMIGLLEGKGKGYAFRLPFTLMFPAATTAGGAAAPAAAPSAVAPAAAPAAPPIPANTVAGSGTFTGQALKFTHGLAWATGNKYEVALFDHAPRANILAELKTGSWGDGGPTATLTFELAAGKTGPAAITHCYVNLEFPKGGPMGLNANSAQKCGLTDLSGDLKAGGNLVARVAGSAPMRDDQPMTWDLRVNLPLK